MAVKFDSKDDMLETWKTMTLDNLADVKFQNDAGAVIGSYADLVLVSETSQETSMVLYRQHFPSARKLIQKNVWMLLKRDRQYRTRRSMT